MLRPEQSGPADYSLEKIMFVIKIVRNVSYVNIFETLHTIGAQRGSVGLQLIWLDAIVILMFLIAFFHVHKLSNHFYRSIWPIWK